MRTRRAFCALLLVAAALQAVVAAQQTLQVTPLTRDGRVLVSFTLSEAFNDDVRAAIHSGMTISFIYEVELKRSSTLWLDRTMDTAVVTAAVRFDNLTRRYHFTRMLNGRIERAETTEREDDVRDWLTEFTKLPLFSSTSLQTNAEYYLRVRAHTSPRNAAFVWPWAIHDVAAHVKFTFIR
jgi:uncharacterized protein DUF4390